jgi:hypothetical protein
MKTRGVGLRVINIRLFRKYYVYPYKTGILLNAKITANTMNYLQHHHGQD